MRAILAALPLALVALQGCVPTDLTLPAGPPPAPSAEARVAEARVRPERLTLVMTDGARCFGEPPEDISRGWTGVTSGCGYALPYTISFAEGGSRDRFAIEQGFGIIGPDGRPGPRAEVFVTDVDGTRRLLIAPLDPAIRLAPSAPASSAPT